MKQLSLLFLVFGLLLLSCKKEESTLSVVPSIELNQSGPALIKAYSDSIFFVISYKDKDGDIGSTESDKDNLFVRDNRMGLVYAYRIHQLVPGGSAVGIQGTVAFSISNTVMLGSGTTESVSYTIWITDRAGNKSNEVNAGPFVVSSL